MNHLDLTPKDETKTYAILSYNGKTWMQEWNKQEAESYQDHIISEGEEGRDGASIIAVLRGNEIYYVKTCQGHLPDIIHTNIMMQRVLDEAEKEQ